MENLEQQIIEMLPGIQEAIDVGAKYTNELFERYVSYLMISDFINIIISLIFLVLFIYLMKYFNKNFSKESYYDHFDYYIINFIIGFMIFAFLIPLYCNIMNIIELIYVPEIIVIQNLT